MNERLIQVPSRPQIARAARRSRAVRASFKRRQRRMIALTAFASLAVGVPVAWSISGQSAGDIVQAAVAQANNLADLLSERSPGSRTEGQLTKTKRARQSAKLHIAPQAPAHAQGRVVEPKIVTPAEIAKILSAPPTLPPIRDLASVTSGDLGYPPPGGGIISSAPTTSGGTPPGGGGPVSFPASEPRETVNSAVPEPATWAMMLVGFGLVGWRLKPRGAKHGGQRGTKARA